MLTDFQKRAARELFGDELAAKLISDAEQGTKHVESLGTGFKRMGERAISLLELVEDGDEGPNYDAAWASGSRWAKATLKPIAQAMQAGVKQGDMSQYFFAQAAQPDGERVDVAGAVFGWGAADKALAQAERQDKARRDAGGEFWKGATRPQQAEPPSNVMGAFFPAAGPTRRARR